MTLNHEGIAYVRKFKSHYWPVSELADRIGVSASTWYRWLRRGLCWANDSGQIRGDVALHALEHHRDTKQLTDKYRTFERTCV